jgi:hypothetical protein
MYIKSTILFLILIYLHLSELLLHFIDYWGLSMISIKCQTKYGITLNELTPFQGDLKKRTSNDVALLAKSIEDEGLLMPFAVWKHDSVNSLLDGHGRYAALMEMSLKDNSILEQALPVIYIEAESEEQAAAPYRPHRKQARRDS